MEITRLIQVRGTLSYQPRTSASPANQRVVTGLLTLREFHSKKDSNIHQWEIAFVDQELGVDSAIALPLGRILGTLGDVLLLSLISLLQFVK